MFQLLPLPLFLLRLLSPARAGIVDALKALMPSISSAPLSIAPPTTWIFLSRIAGDVLVFLLIRDCARRLENDRWAPAIPLIGIGGVEAILGLAGRSGPQSISGTYYSKDFFSGLLEMILPFAVMYGVVLIYRGRERGASAAFSIVNGLALLALAAAMFAAITLSLSKGGFMAMLGSLFVMGVLSLATSSRFGFLRWKKSAAMEALAAVIVLIFIYFPTDELVKQFGSAASDQTGEGRLPMARDTLHMFAAYPLFGTGLGTFYPGLLRYQTYALNFAVLNAHNDYLQLLSELGIVGCLIPAALIYMVFAGAVRTALSGDWREVRFLAIACTGGMTALLLHSFGDFSLYVPANAMVFAWIAGISAGLPGPIRHGQGNNIEGRARLVRGLVFALASYATIYAGAWLVFLHSYTNNVAAERVFCRFGICDSMNSTNLLRNQHRGDESGVPRADLIEFLRRDPAAPYNWEDLGDSFRHAGERAKASTCFATAVQLGPRIPSTLMRAANFHFGLDENKEALGLMARTMEADPGYESEAFRVYEQRRIPLNEILLTGLPNSAYAGYLRFLIASKKSTDAQIVFQRIVARGDSDDKLANEYVGFLLQNKEPEAAAQAWALYAGGRDKSYPESNRVFNGDFESEPTGSLFDWTIEQTPGAAIDFDRQVAHSGARSLRIQFEGTQNLSNIGVRQTVFLKPGRYRFQAHVRTQEISTDEGISFRVASEQAPKLLSFTTEPILGSSDWKLVEHVFVAPPGTGLADVTLVRTPSLRFDSLIRGTLWIDQVSISPNNQKTASR